MKGSLANKNPMAKLHFLATIESVIHDTVNKETPQSGSW